MDFLLALPVTGRVANCWWSDSVWNAVKPNIQI
jgi:hypothetical protein